jgi:hypothetical protein
LQLESRDLVGLRFVAFGVAPLGALVLAGVVALCAAAVLGVCVFSVTLCVTITSGASSSFLSGHVMALAATQLSLLPDVFCFGRERQLGFGLCQQRAVDSCGCRDCLI